MRERIAARMDKTDVAVNPRTFNNTPSTTAAAKLPLNLKVTLAPTHAATAPTGPAPSTTAAPPPSGSQVQKVPGVQATTPPAASSSMGQPTQAQPQAQLQPDYSGVAVSSVPDVTGSNQPLNITSSQSEGSVAATTPGVVNVTNTVRRRSTAAKLGGVGLGVGALLAIIAWRRR